MKGLSFLLLLFCFSHALAQKQYSLELNFKTDNNEHAPNIKIVFFKDSPTGAIIIDRTTADDKGVLKLKLTDRYFDENNSVIIEASYHRQDTYYFDYHEKLSKGQFPFKKTVILEHIVPPTLEQINNMNPPPPPPPKSN